MFFLSITALILYIFKELPIIFERALAMSCFPFIFYICLICLLDVIKLVNFCYFKRFLVLLFYFIYRGKQYSSTYFRVK